MCLASAKYGSPQIMHIALAHRVLPVQVRVVSVFAVRFVVRVRLVQAGGLSRRH